MSDEPIGSLLLVEDDASSARLILETFRTMGSPETVVTHVESMGDAEKLLAGHAFDIVLLDPGLPDSHGIESIQRAHSAAPRVPLVVLTGREDESLALQALQEGAQDYLVKGQIHPRGLLRFLRYALERSTLEGALFGAEKRAQVTLDSIGDAVACTDISGAVTFLNGVAEELTGWSLQEAMGQPVAEVIRIVDSETHETIASPTARAIEQGRTVHLPPSSVLIRRDGLETPIEDSAATIHDREERATGAVIVFRDVSAARSTQDELHAVSAELERSNRELQDFAAIASHDLQEPLRKIRAFGDRLAEQTSDVLDEGARDSLERMTSAAGRMQTLIDDLLEYSQLAIRPEPTRAVDLGVVVSDVLIDLDERIGASGGRVRVSELPTVVASPLRMRQLFQNLIANALKFHPPGVAPEVRIEASPRGGRQGSRKGRDGLGPTWEIRVRDNGIGFDERHGEKIFAPFQRLNGRQAYEGTGMGLAICRRIVAGLDGTITATSKPGSGTTFVVTLPRSEAGADALLPVA